MSHHISKNVPESSPIDFHYLVHSQIASQYSVLGYIRRWLNQTNFCSDINNADAFLLDISQSIHMPTE